MHSPNFVELSSIAEQLLRAKLDAVRFAIAHAGEKGRELEHQVRRILRETLPPEYGLTSGFIAHLTPDGPKLSTQLDIIIYDALRHSALVHLEGCDVIPLEAAYGYVEVKASICSTTSAADNRSENSIEACISKNAPLRAMKTRVYREYVDMPAPALLEHKERFMSLRSYVVAFEPAGAVANSAEAFAARMAAQLKTQGNSHLHGVLIVNHGFFYTIPVNPLKAADEDYYHVRYATDRPLLAFRTLLLQGLATFQRPPSSWVPAIDLYFPHKFQWHEAAPTVSQIE